MVYEYLGLDFESDSMWALLGQLAGEKKDTTFPSGPNFLQCSSFDKDSWLVIRGTKNAFCDSNLF